MENVILIPPMPEGIVRRLALAGWIIGKRDRRLSRTVRGIGNLLQKPVELVVCERRHFVQEVGSLDLIAHRVIGKLRELGSGQGAPGPLAEFVIPERSRMARGIGLRN